MSIAEPHVTVSAATLDDEAFHNAYYYFAQSLSVLAAAAADQCHMMGGYNVAWELKDDVSAGAYLVGRGYLSPAQEGWVAVLVGALAAADTQSMPGGDDRDANLAAMTNPCWEPLRYLAEETLRQLEPFTVVNGQYLRLSSGGA